MGGAIWFKSIRHLFKYYKEGKDGGPNELCTWNALDVPFKGATTLYPIVPISATP